MPKFLDHHPTVAEMPQEAVDDLRAKIQSGQPDQFGVTGLNVFIGSADTWCYTDAPGPDAVHSTHEAMGINLGPGDVLEVQSLV